MKRFTGLDFRRELYGEPEAGGEFDPTVSSLYVQVLRPLCWTGLLHEQRQNGSRPGTTMSPPQSRVTSWLGSSRLKGLGYDLPPQLRRSRAINVTLPSR